MSQKAQFTLAGLIGSTIGGFVPSLWGASFLSTSAIIGNVIGGIIGIALVYKFTSDF
jgi:uncharacterized membrane protein YeaQ/YmgE (transglycosylase-associated protein family)